MSTSSTSTPGTTPSPSTPDQTEGKRPSKFWPTLRTYLGVAIIVIWGLAPFYWMVVTSFREVAYTYDTTPWPTHVTWANYETAFSTNSKAPRSAKDPEPAGGPVSGVRGSS